MDDIINMLAKDLESYPTDELDSLVRFHRLKSGSRDEIAHKNLQHIFRANMDGKTYNTKQLGDVIDFINHRFRRNICLRKGLIITHYTDKPTVDFFSTWNMYIQQQPIDIYEHQTRVLAREVDGPWSILDDLVKITAPRFCFFIIWVKRDGHKKHLPVVESHITLAICDKEGADSYAVYKYNSGFTSETVERSLDRSVEHFFSLTRHKTATQYRLVPTISWCPMALQGTSNLCTVYVFHIYQLLLENPDNSPEEILTHNPQRDIVPFLTHLAKYIVGKGAHDIRL